jgi:DNA polymerase I-like protein with 3'-5' exonuclease and polymerase domains
MLVTTAQSFIELSKDAPRRVVVDVETKDKQPGLENLLGVAFSWPGVGFYVSFNIWDGYALITNDDAGLVGVVMEFLRDRDLIGWNVEYDREWIDTCFGINSRWCIDGRVLWYLSDKKQRGHKYGLKNGQTEVLGFPERGDNILADSISLAGGLICRGDHYMAPVDILSAYATLDATSTRDICALLLRPENDYFELVAHHTFNMQYAKVLARAERRGVECDKKKLFAACEKYSREAKKAEEDIKTTCASEISQWEKRALAAKLDSYSPKAAHAKARFLTAADKHPKFNPKSSKHRAELLFDICGLPTLSKTKGGAPSTDKATIAKLEHPVAKAFVALSEAKKLVEMASTYLECVVRGRIHFPLDTCATITERLGGFKPYALNFPFDAQAIGEAFTVSDGYRGYHLDFTSIEPTVLAAFSKDPTLLKVYRDGLGDIYLDLCLELFPGLLPDYDTMAPPTEAVKEQYKKYRKIAKVVHLALSYNGTWRTISKSLTAAGFPTTGPQAEQIVAKYWKRFAKVKEFSDKLQHIARTKGYVTGLLGRRLYIPGPKVKDAMNTFCQHGAHAILRELVMTMDRRAREDKLDMYPLLPDVHDSTSWEIRMEHWEDGVEVFKDAVEHVNQWLKLPGIEIKAECREFKTFAGLKARKE